MKNQLLLLVAIFMFSSIALFAENKNAVDNKKLYVAEIETAHGNITIVLLNETPLHRDNIVTRSKKKFYDGLTFHRVIKGFVIQAGDAANKDIDSELLKQELYRPAIHTVGAVAMAREGDKTNPERKSSSTHFYIIPGGNKLSENGLANYEKHSGYKYTEEEKESYLTKGGTPNLDANYVVFGYVIDGMDAVKAIESVKTNKKDGPEEKQVIEKMRVKKMSLKALEKKYGYYAR